MIFAFCLRATVSDGVREQKSGSGRVRGRHFGVGVKVGFLKISPKFLIKSDFLGFFFSKKILKNFSSKTPSPDSPRGKYPNPKKPEVKNPTSTPTPKCLPRTQTRPDPDFCSPTPSLIQTKQ